jgi:hypothetical protein
MGDPFAKTWGRVESDREGGVPRHFFFGKIRKIELEPLKPEQMVEACRKRSKALDPFTEEAGCLRSWSFTTTILVDESGPTNSSV